VDVFLCLLEYFELAPQGFATWYSTKVWFSCASISQHADTWRSKQTPWITRHASQPPVFLWTVSALMHHPQCVCVPGFID